jgi:hypothetical protein
MLPYIFSGTPSKDIQAPGEASGPTENSSKFNHESFPFFSPFSGDNFGLSPDPDPKHL